MTAAEHRATSLAAEDLDEAYLANPPLVTVEPLDTLTAEWAALHGEGPANPPFNHPAWFRAWMAHFGAGREALFLAVRRDGELIGVVPLTTEAGTVQLLGDPDVSDYAGIATRPGSEPFVARGLAEWLGEDLATHAVLWGIREGIPLRAALTDAAAYFGWRLTETDEAVSPATDLPASWDAYLAGLSKKHRHELRRKLRRLEAAGQVTMSRTSSSADAAAGVDLLFRLMRESRDDKRAFLTPAMEAFFRDLAAEFTARGMACFRTLLLDGDPVATVFCFESPTATFLYNSGYDPAASDLAVGLLSKALALRDAIESGKRTFDFLRGDERYKFELGGEPRRVLRLELRR